MSVGDNIRRLREAHGLSQKELAEIAGVTDKAVSTWETGVNIPRMGVIQKIADYFEIQKSNIIEDRGLYTKNEPTLREEIIQKINNILDNIPDDKLDKFRLLLQTAIDIDTTN